MLRAKQLPMAKIRAERGNLNFGRTTGRNRSLASRVDAAEEAGRPAGSFQRASRAPFRFFNASSTESLRSMAGGFLTAVDETVDMVYNLHHIERVERSVDAYWLIPIYLQRKVLDVRRTRRIGVKD